MAKKDYRRKLMRAFTLIGSMLLTTSAFAQQSTSRSMSFEDCLRVIRNTASELGVAPVNIVETSEVRMVRFKTADGSVLLTCSRADKKMVMTVSKR